jgi:hypothetical protein
MMEFVTSGSPTKGSGVYMVDRGEKQGKAFRFYNADSGKWSICCYEPAEAEALKDTVTALPFLPYVDALVKVKATPVQALVGGPSAKALAIVAKAEAKMAKATKTPKTKTAKVVHPDGTVFFREDRQKWVVVVDGKQPAARPTKEGVVKWLAKAHPTIQPVELTQ